MSSPDLCTCSDTQDLADEMASWRQALHRQPELAFARSAHIEQN